MISADGPVPPYSIVIPVFDESESVLGVFWIAKRTTLPARTIELRSESER